MEQPTFLDLEFQRKNRAEYAEGPQGAIPLADGLTDSLAESAGDHPGLLFQVRRGPPTQPVGSYAADSLRAALLQPQLPRYA